MRGFLRRPGLAGVVAVAAAVLGAAGSGRAEPLSINGWTNPPVGYVDFCRAYGDQCTPHGSAAAEILIEPRWRDLKDINNLVNHTVIPATDKEFYQAEEVWTLPEAYGDCEDYVLLKRKLLIERGWPTGSLLITVVFDEVGEGHAVLLVRTDRGDFVLDNKSDAIRLWYETAYRFVKRQSVSDPNRWVSLGDPRRAAQSTAAPR
jgi:predicted transglutaminase-like cysteine proteinase